MTEAFHSIADDLAGTPGLLGSEMLEALTDTGSVVVMSEWTSLVAFQTWERGADHKSTTAPLRSYQDRSRERTFEVYEVAACAVWQG
jgi:heme-degrading monooxygenase HmoA